MIMLTAEGLRAADAAAARAGVPTLLLMEAAGRALAAAVRRHWPEARRPLLLCGPGNNGGDGYAAARWLRLAGLEPAVLELPGARRDDAHAARTALAAFLAPEPLAPDRLEAALARADLVVDALFGSGLRRPLAGGAAEAVARVNAAGLPVLSADLPSGVGADSPVPPGPFVRATRTLQFAAPKLSSAFYPARAAYGQAEVVGVGHPPGALGAGRARLLTSAAARAALPRRAPDTHKYRAGTVLVVAGSPRYPGAAELACRGAYRAGAGLVTLAGGPGVGGAPPEVVRQPLAWAAPEPLAQLAAVGDNRAGALVVGPGLDDRAEPHLAALISARAAPCVLDAGALVPRPALAAAVRTHGRCVLTPHHGEAARLLGTTAGAVRGDPLGAAERLAREWGATVVLKGPTTVVAPAAGAPLVSTRGAPGLATAGSGDVLAGVIAAFLAAPASPGSLAGRVAAAVYLHGLAGELAWREVGDGMTALDVVERLPAARRALMRGGGA